LKFIRIIPRLDIKGPNLVKGIHLEGLRVLGRPEYFAEEYYKQGADEIIYQDTVASLYQRNSLIDIVKRTSEYIYIPLTVGGGIRSLEDINNVLRAGADKVAINTSAIKNPDFITKASKVFGSSTIVVAIEAIKQSNNKYLAYTDNGREYTGVDVKFWSKEVENLGAGEILLTSIDFEGTGSGFDYNLIELVSKNTNIPVIAHGGASKKEDIKKVINNSGTDAVAISSMLHYSTLESNLSVENYKYEGNIEFIRNQKSHKKFGKQNIQEIKRFLKSNNVPVRLLDKI
tara:strand:+ start:17930 stop:18790 length:861 start_codon:yes stop_codon:yes gene_type:complete